MIRDLGALAGREHDLLVVGGGIHGLAAAWDAAQRGLAVALVERDDFGAGVSWNSLKTIHGGLRYLQKADLARVRESVRERRALLRIAPALVKPLGFLVPTYGHGRRGREAMACGLWLSDLLSADRNRGLPAASRIAPSRRLSRTEALARVPGLPAAGLNGAAFWYDGQVESSERLAIGFAHAAADAGAVLTNHLEALSLRSVGGRIVGARARDRTTGLEMDITARVTLNAAGPGALALLAEAGLPPPAMPLLRAMNLVLDGPTPASCAVGALSGGRYLFLVPWRDRAMVGTAYEPAEEPEAPESAARFLEEARRAFPWADLGARRIALVHRGLVPGRGGAEGLRTRTLVIDHAREEGTLGLVTMLGVKYTTARGVAEEAVDLLAGSLGRTLPASRTAETPLTRARALEGNLEERTRVAVRDEMALSLGDALLRRLELGNAGSPSTAEVAKVAAVMAAELGWDEARLLAEQAALTDALARAGMALTPA